MASSALSRRFTSLSVKQIIAIVASFVAIYVVSTHHKALQEWFAPPKQAVRARAAAPAAPAAPKSS